MSTSKQITIAFIVKSIFSKLLLLYWSILRQAQHDYLPQKKAEPSWSRH